MLEFENEELRRVFYEILGQELYEFTNLEWILEMAKLGYQMELPYKSFWSALVNIVLIKHQEFTFLDSDETKQKSLIDLLFYIVKSQRQATSSTNRLSKLIALDHELLPKNLQNNRKLVRRAQLNLLLSYIQQEIELQGVENIPATMLLKLLTTD